MVSLSVECRAQCADGLFPTYFSPLFAFLSRLVLPEYSSPDARVRHICDNYGALLCAVAGVCDPLGEDFFRYRSLSESLQMGQLDDPCVAPWRSEWGWEWVWVVVCGGVWWCVVVCGRAMCGFVWSFGLAGCGGGCNAFVFYFCIYCTVRWFCCA